MTTAKWISSSKMEGRADVRLLQNPAEPLHLFGRLKKWVFPIDGCVLLFHDIIDFSNRIGGRIPDLPNMQRNELQSMRIDVTGVDEALSFLGATAGIVRVHQSALAVHELVEIAAGARQALPKVVGRHLQDFTADGVARTKDFPQREDQSLPAVQTEQHPGCA